MGLTKAIRHWYFVVRGLYRVLKGRLHVWRDAPDEVIEKVALLEGDPSIDRREMFEAIRQARAELNARRMNGRMV